MAFQNVHNPIQAPDEYVDKYDFIKQKMRRVHAGMADILDEAVGNITQMFKEKGYVCRVECYYEASVLWTWFFRGRRK